MINRKPQKYLGEVTIIVPKRTDGISVDAVALQTINELYKCRGLDKVIADKAQKFSLIANFCNGRKIGFSERSLDYLDSSEIADLFNPDSKRLKFALLAVKRSDAVLEMAAEELSKRGYRTEIRKIY